MQKLNEYFDEIQIRIDEVYEDLKKMLGASKVSSLAIKEGNLLNPSVMAVLTDSYLYGYENLILNITILLDNDSKSLNLEKVLNKIQANPKQYSLDEAEVNKNYKLAKKKLDSLKATDTFKDLLKQRDKLIAHCDLKYATVSSKIDLEKTTKLCQGICELIEMIFSWFNRSLTPFNEGESDIEVIYKIFKKAGSPLSI